MRRDRGASVVEYALLAAAVTVIALSATASLGGPLRAAHDCLMLRAVSGMDTPCGPMPIPAEQTGVEEVDP